jgi:hypothetical protein
MSNLATTLAAFFTAYLLRRRYTLLQLRLRRYQEGTLRRIDPRNGGMPLVQRYTAYSEVDSRL